MRVADCLSAHSRRTVVTNKHQIDGAWLNRKVMTMLKKLMLILILGMIMSGPAAPILKSFVGIGSTTAYAADGDQDGDSQGEDGDGGFDGQ